VFEVKGLQAGIGSAHILRGVDLRAEEGSLCGLIGRNGAGKTTFMRCIMGLLPATAGTLVLGSQDLGRLKSHERAGLGIGYMPEDRRLVPDFSVEDNLLVPAWALSLADASQRLARVYELIPEVREFRARRANQLSGGQQKLAALARALIGGRTLLLLDEPFEGVAPALATRLADVLSDIKATGVTVLVAESNESHIAHLLDEVYVIERGAVRLV
jgi:branched-chain amino acid transport system ATP-binding protein